MIVKIVSAKELYQLDMKFYVQENQFQLPITKKTLM